MENKTEKFDFLYGLEELVDFDIKTFINAIYKDDVNSIFKILLDDIDMPHYKEKMDTLRKCVFTKDYKILLKYLYTYHPESKYHNFLSRLYKTVYKYENFNIDDALCKGQIQSKLWLTNRVSHIWKDLGHVYICAGWYGLLAQLLENNTKSILSIDQEESCEEIANFINHDNNFKAITMNIHDINYYAPNIIYKDTKHFSVPDTIINTSCEHIVDYKDWWRKIKKGTKVVLQSNNYDGHEGHINCHVHIKDFIASSPMTELLYADKLQLKDFYRYMIIGIK